MDFQSLKTVLILGLGVSGRDAACFLLHQGKEVIALDHNCHVLKNHKDVASLLEMGLQLIDVWPDEGIFIDLCILSPGIPWNHPFVLRAKQCSLEVLGEVEFALKFLNHKILAITGSNGKTTTAYLITHALKSKGIPAKTVGNNGVSVSSYLMQQDPNDVIVLELSSFQLESLHHPFIDVGVILNIFPNHLDRYESMESYAAAKLLMRHLIKENGLFLVSKQVRENFSVADPVFEEFDNWTLSENAAFAICKQFGITRGDFERCLETFEKPPHRLEKCLELEDVVYINDSKSSNVNSVVYALNTMKKPVILIIGGKDKGSSYEPWIDAFEGKVKHVIAYGAAREKINLDIGHKILIKSFALFDEAVDHAKKIAKKGDVVLLSPGCSSYDQFQNFEHRGNVFKELVGKVHDGAQKNHNHRSDH